MLFGFKAIDLSFSFRLRSEGARGVMFGSPAMTLAAFMPPGAELELVPEPPPEEDVLPTPFGATAHEQVMPIIIATKMNFIYPP
jgi:hypothetical protein